MIIDSFRSGTSKSEISKKFEVSISTVNRIINNSQDRPVQKRKIEDILESSIKDDKTTVQNNSNDRNSDFKEKISLMRDLQDHQVFRFSAGSPPTDRMDRSH